MCILILLNKSVNGTQKDLPFHLKKSLLNILTEILCFIYEIESWLCNPIIHDCLNNFLSGTVTLLSYPRVSETEVWFFTELITV